MFTKHEMIFWTDELIFMRGAAHEQLERYSNRWRATFIAYGADIAEVYIPAIRSMQSVIRKLNQELGE